MSTVPAPVPADVRDAFAAWHVPERQRPFALEPLPWAHPTMLAPMEGITHPPLRALLAAHGGLGIVCTEFVRVTRNAVSPKVLRRQVVRAPGVPLCVQVMGNDVERMAEAAEMMVEAGADVVDINLGCPAPRVVRKGVGSAMLTRPALLYDVLCAMRERVPGLLSAKIRAGFDDAEHVVTIARTVEAAGADYLVVHPRRRADFYDGVADWRIIATLKQALRIPIVGNGDVWYATDALRMERETGCDGVMIGRPALRNPWIFRQVDELRRGVEPFRPDGEDLWRWFETLARTLDDHFGYDDAPAIGRVKEMVTWVGRAVRDGGAWRREALRVPELDALMAFAEQGLRSLSVDELDLSATGDDPLERSGAA